MNTSPKIKTGSRICALLIVAALTSCEKKPGPPVTTDPIVLARVGGKEITEADFRDELARRTARRQPVASKLELLQEMVTHQALVQRAKRAGLEEDAEVTRLYHNLLIGHLRERDLEEQLKTIEITEEEIQAEYEKQITKYTIGAKARLAILFRQVVRNPEENVRLRDQLMEARKLALSQPTETGRGPATTGFGALAISNSEDQSSRYKGGDIGWLEQERRGYQWPDAVISAGFALAKGDVSEVIEAEGGYYLVMKTDEREQTIAPLQEVKPSIRHQLLTTKRARLEEEFKEESRRLAQAELFTNNLSKVEVPTSGPKAVQPPPPALPQ